MKKEFHAERSGKGERRSVAKIAQGMVLVSMLGCGAGQQVQPIPERTMIQAQRPSEAHAPRLEAGLERVLANADTIRRLAREGDTEWLWRLAVNLMQCGSGCNRTNFFRALEVARGMESRAQDDIDTGLNPDAKINS